MHKIEMIIQMGRECENRAGKEYYFEWLADELRKANLLDSRRSAKALIYFREPVEDHETKLKKTPPIEKHSDIRSIKMKKRMTFRSICDRMYTVYCQKNEDYGDSYSKLRKKHPNSFLIRASDKLNRIEVLMKQEGQVKNESIEDTLLDLANYCILELTERRADKALISDDKADKDRRVWI